MNLNLDALETSFDHIAPRGDELMDVFYARLFAAAPASSRSSREPTSSGRRRCSWPRWSSSAVASRPRLGHACPAGARSAPCPLRSSTCALPGCWAGADLLDGTRRRRRMDPRARAGLDRSVRDRCRRHAPGRPIRRSCGLAAGTPRVESETSTRLDAAIGIPRTSRHPTAPQTTSPGATMKLTNYPLNRERSLNGYASAVSTPSRRRAPRGAAHLERPGSRPPQGRGSPGCSDPHTVGAGTPDPPPPNQQMPDTHRHATSVGRSNPASPRSPRGRARNG